MARVGDRREAQASRRGLAIAGIEMASGRLSPRFAGPRGAVAARRGNAFPRFGRLGGTPKTSPAGGDLASDGRRRGGIEGHRRQSGDRLLAASETAQPHRLANPPRRIARVELHGRCEVFESPLVSPGEAKFAERRGGKGKIGMSNPHVQRDLEGLGTPIAGLEVESQAKRGLGIAETSLRQQTPDRLGFANAVGGLEQGGGEHERLTILDAARDRVEQRVGGIGAEFVAGPRSIATDRPLGEANPTQAKRGPCVFGMSLGQSLRDAGGFVDSPGLEKAIDRPNGLLASFDGIGGCRDVGRLRRVAAARHRQRRGHACRNEAATSPRYDDPP